MKLATLLLIIAVSPFTVAADDDTKARKELVGTWKGRVQQGATGHILTFTTARITGKQATRDLGEGSFVLDQTKKPWKMDATYTKGPQKGSTYLGIYTLDGDTLKWCVSVPGSERPTKFGTGGSDFYLILGRQKK